MPWNPPHAGVALGTMTDLTWNAHYVPAMPRFFLTGDGHAHPPFNWAVGGASQAMSQHFRVLATQNQLCLHVETFQDEVDKNSVPSKLSAVFGNSRVFGWEPAVMKVVEAALNQIMALASILTGQPDSDEAVHEAVAAFDRSVGVIVGKIGTDIPNNCDQQVVNAAANWTPVKKYLEGVYGTGGFFDRFGSRKPRHEGNERAHAQTMVRLQNGLMTLRDSMNPTFGAMIQAKINQYPNDTHLIACGWAHILTANLLLQNCIAIGNNAGIVDPNTTR